MLPIAHPFRQRAAEVPAVRLVGGQESADLVVAEAVDVEFLDVEPGIVEQELTDIGVPHGESEAASAAVLVGEIETIVVVAAIGSAVEIVDTVVVELAVDGKTTSMIVDDVEGNGDAIDMAEIDQRLQLSRRRSKVPELKRRLPASRAQQLVQGGEISRQIGRLGDVGKVGREQVGAAIAHRWTGLLLVYR